MPQRIRALVVVCGVFLTLATTGGVARAELTLTIADGKVTLVADNVSVRQILAEWSRLGQTKVVGAEKLPATPVTLRLANVPEARALDTLLRTTSGYVVAPRPVAMTGASQFDRILIMPPSTMTASAAPAGGRPSPISAPQPPPVMQAPVPTSEPTMENDDEPPQTGDEPPGNPYSNRPPETNFDYANPQEMLQKRMEQQQMSGPQGPPTVFPGSVVIPQQGETAQPASGPSAFPGAPTTATRPGEIVQPPQPTFTNPYGIPYPQQGPVPPPTATTPGQMPPDRSKYFNPYQPQQPPKPPSDEQ